MPITIGVAPNAFVNSESPMPNAAKFTPVNRHFILPGSKEKVMSTHYAALAPIHFADLFDGRLKDVGVHEQQSNKAKIRLPREDALQTAGISYGSTVTSKVLYPRSLGTEAMHLNVFFGRLLISLM
jgi:hypothetical protein